MRRAGLLATITLACTASWFLAYSNDCGAYPLNGPFDEDHYMRPSTPLLRARGFLMTLGLGGVPMAAAAGAVSPHYTRVAYILFAIMWASVLLSWQSPCRQHKLEAGSYLALTSVAAAMLTSIVHD